MAKDVRVEVKGSTLWIGVDLSGSLEECPLTSTGKSHVIGRTDGLMRVQVGDRTLRVQAGVYEMLAPADAYEAKVQAAAAEMVAAGMKPDVALATARKIVAKPKDKTANADDARKALAAARSTGVSAESAEPEVEPDADDAPIDAPAIVGKAVADAIVPPARPSVKGVSVAPALPPPARKPIRLPAKR
jgi:hypothetical protein